MKDNVGISFKEAIQEALAEEDSVESDLPQSTVEVADESDAPVVDQPVVESDEQSGLFDSMFVDKQEGDEGQLPPGEEPISLRINGRLMSIPEIEAGVLMQDDYTRKTQELAELRKEADKALVLWRALEERPQETVRSLWQRVAGGQPAVQEDAPNAQPSNIEAIIEAKLQERLANDPRLRLIEEETALQEINLIFGQIEGSNNVSLSDSDKTTILTKAQELGTDNLFAAFDVLMAEKIRFEKARHNAQANSSVSGNRGTADDDAPSSKTFGSWREAMDDSLREENVLDTVFNFQ